MFQNLSTTRIRALYLSITSSRLLYVLLVDTALTFVLFTFLYHHHFTSILHSNTVVALCRSLRTTTPTGLPPHFHQVCHASSTILSSPPTTIQRFLSVTKEVVLGAGDFGDQDYLRIRSERNWKVVKFVALKVVALLILFGVRCVRNDDRTGIEGRIKLEETRNALGQDRKSVTVLVQPASPSLPSFSSPPPAYSTPNFSPTPLLENPDQNWKEETASDEDEFPWILLALSLIGHLVVVLFDQGAIQRILNSSVVRDRWAVVGFFLIGTGVVGIWRESTMGSSPSREGSGEAVSRHMEVSEKSGMVVINL